MADFHVHFEKTGKTYDITFREQEKSSSDTVIVNGRHYKLDGAKEKVTWVKRNLHLSSETSITSAKLKQRLISLKVSNPIIAKLVHSLGISTLRVQKPISPEVLGRWISVREKFRAFTKRLEKTIPEGRAAHISLVLPPEIERVIGPLTFSRGTTSSSHENSERVYNEKSNLLKKKIDKAEKHIERLKLQHSRCRKGKAGRAKRTSLSEQIDIHAQRLAELKKELQTLRRGKKVDQYTLSNIGSSAKVTTGLLTAVMENQGFLRFGDSIARFFPKEAMDNFQRHLSFDESVEIAPANITVEALASMTAGLTYTGDCGIKAEEIDPSSTPLDSILRDHFERNSIPFVGRPNDKLWSYSNQIQLTAYVIEKAFKEKLARNLVQEREELGSNKLESFFDESLTTRLKIIDIPPKIRNMSLNELLEICSDPDRQNAYIEGVYIYDLLDVVLAKESPGAEHLVFADALNQELLAPLGAKEATYTPEKTTLLAEDRVLTYPGTGKIADPSILRQGCGTLYMNAADETHFVRALMKPALYSTDGRCLVTDKQMEAFISPKSANVEEGTGGIRFKERPLSICVEKGGSFNDYHHHFQCERMKDPSRHSEAVGIVMLNNFQTIDQEFLREYDALYQEVLTTLHGSTRIEESLSIPEPGSVTILPHGQGLIKDAETLFKGTRGFFAYSPGEFLNWSGTPYKIYTSEDSGKEYIFHRGRPLEVTLHEREGLSYLSLGEDFIAAQIRNRSQILEAEATSQASQDILDAKAVFPKLIGTYDGDHPQGYKDIHITEEPTGVLRFDHHVGGASSLQIVSVTRDELTKAVIGMQMTGTFREPPDMMLNFRKTEGGSWVFHIADFIDPSRQFEKCTKK